MKQNLLLFPILFCFFSFTGSYGQSTEKDSSINLIEAYSLGYLSHSQNQAVLFSGKVHQPLSRYSEGMFMRDRFSREFDERGKEKFPTPVASLLTYGKGSLEYDGVFYPDVNLRLDLVNDELVVLSPNMLYGVVLDGPRVGYADFKGYRVFYVNSGDFANQLPEGYYVELFAGEHRVLKKERIYYDKLDNTYKSWAVRYYIEKDGTYHQIRRTNGSVMNVLGSHKKELKQYIRAKRIYAGRDTETAVVQIVSEYERLNLPSGL